MNIEILRVFRFLAIGFINTCFGYLVYSILFFLTLPLIVCVIGSTVVGVLFNFFSYGRVVFGVTSNQRLPRFLISYILIGVLNYLCLLILTGIGIDPLISQAMLLLVLAVAGYVIMRLYVFF